MTPDLPKSWEWRRLGEVSSESTDRGGNGFERSQLYGVTNSVGMIPMKDRVKGKSIERYKIVKPNAFAYNPMRINVGSIAPWTGSAPVVVSPDYVVFEADPARLDHEYLNQLRQTPAWSRFIDDAGRGSVRVRIYYSRLADFEFPLPPLVEQKKIAEILGSVDEAIQATQAVIDQTRKIKQGLLQQLLTRGIGHTRFKQTEIGEIPESWEIIPLETLAEVSYGLTVNPSRRSSKETAPYLTVANVGRDGLNLSQVKEIGLLPGDRQRYALEIGDILLVEGNGNRELLGKPVMWRGEVDDCCHQNHLIRARVTSRAISASWLLRFLSASTGRGQILREAKTSSGLHTINSRVVSQVGVAVPPIAEQRRIDELLRTIEGSADTQADQLISLNQLKRGLMQDLLTGRVRVAA